MQHSPRFVRLCEETRAHVTEISAEELFSRLKSAPESFQLVDVREDHEWAAGHLPGARHLGRGILERDIEKNIPDLDAEIVLYCGGGYRSALATDSLQKMGYRRVRSLAGGFRGWNEARFPITNDASPQDKLP